MKYWILVISLLAMGCSGGESGNSDEQESAGAEIADVLNDAQDEAANVENVLQDARDEVDAAIEAAEDTDED